MKSTAPQELRSALASAQRLSASKEVRLCLAASRTPRTWSCSTLFGIKGSQTNRLKVTWYHVGVLNAFRHQRKSDIPVIRIYSLFILVLNAFRHQRKSDATIAPLCCRRLHVLNAFRHQRKSDQASWTAVTSTDLCSTPFGIKGSQT